MLAAPAIAQAQTPTPQDANSENRALAETLFFTARGLMEAGRYPEACVKLAESHRLDPAAGTLLNLAVCHEKEGKLASAWGEFRQALADARRLNRPDRVQLAEERIAAITPELPMITIQVPASTRVAGLEVRRNGVPLLGAAWSTELPVDPGAVEVTWQAPGYLARHKSVTIERRQHLSIELEPLTPAPPPPAQGVSTAPRAETYRWSGGKKIGLGMMIGGVVAAGVGGFFGVRALVQRSNSDELCPEFDGERRCTDEGASRMNAARTSAWISNIGLGVGAASFVIGAILFAKGKNEPVPASAAAGSRTLRWSLGGSPNAMTATVSGVF
jgi:hypothetical protein